MNNLNFNEWLDIQLDNSKLVLVVKAAEYGQEHDRLHNFNKASGILQGIYDVISYKGDHYDALIGMWLKHFVSVLDLIEATRKEETVTPRYNHNLDKLKQLSMDKNGDNINYMVLLKYMIDEDYQELENRYASYLLAHPDTVDF